MNSKKITDEEISGLTVSSLPTRPTAPTAFGGAGYTSSEIKAAFDRLPLLLVDRYNSLIDDAESYGEGSLASSIPTGISETHTLSDLFCDIESGALARYMTIGGGTLYSVLERLCLAVFGEGLDG